MHSVVNSLGLHSGSTEKLSYNECMKQIAHLLTLLGMVSMLWASTPSQSTVCLPNTAINQCCESGLCDPGQLCVCCEKAVSPSALAGRNAASESSQSLQVLPASRSILAPMTMPSDSARHQLQISALERPSEIHPVKLYLLHRALLI